VTGVVGMNGAGRRVQNGNGVGEDDDDAMQIDFIVNSAVVQLRSADGASWQEKQQQQQRQHETATASLRGMQVRGVMVVDTNFLLSQLAWIKSFVKHAQTINIAVLVPWIVVEELDALKVSVAQRAMEEI